MSSRRLGLLVLLAAALVNEWTVATFLGLEKGFDLPALRVSIWAFQLLAALAGGALLVRARRIHKGYLVVIPFCILALLAGAEMIAGMVLTRGRDPVRRKSNLLGWETAPGARLRYSHPAFGPVSITTGAHGFRRWDSRDSLTTTVLAIGDSYTEALQVSDGNTWFDHVSRIGSPVSVFAYGTGGYGTLQEYMILDRHIDSIRPDAIIWQLSANDLINNDFFLETQNPAGARMRRPFYEDRRVVYRFPAPGIAVKYSRLVRFINARIAMLEGHGFAAASLGREREKFPDALERSIGTTRALMEMAARRAGGIPIFAFVSEGDSYADSVLSSAATASGWEFLPGIRDSVEAARARGIRVSGLPRDGHWNAAGHAIAGRVIARQLMSRGILREHHRGDDRRSENAADDRE